MGLQQVLESDLADDFLRAVGGGVDAAKIDSVLGPYLGAIRSNLAILEVPAGELAKQWGVDEAIVREAQALLRQGDGGLDERMLLELKQHSLPMTFDFSEPNAGAHDVLAAKGRAIIASGAKWKGRLLADICKGSFFTITHDHFDGLTHQNQRLQTRFEITSLWIRGFEIAIGLCEGASEDNPEQRRVGAALIGNTADGFVAGQEVQFNRTNPFGVLIKERASVDPKALALAKPPQLKDSLSRNAATAQRAHVEGNLGVKASSTVLKLHH